MNRLSAPDIGDMVRWIASLRCSWCGAPDDDEDMHAVAWRAIAVRRTRIDAQCGSCGLVVSFSAAEVRRFWNSRPNHRSPSRLIPVQPETVERLLGTGVA